MTFIFSELGMSESLFERLYSKEAVIALNLNYRMNTTITALANHVTYGGKLLIGSSSVAEATLKLPKKDVRLSSNPLPNYSSTVLDVRIF